MKQLAEVIVDIPLFQTDKPFSYAIPKHLEGMVRAGMRVHLPFGKGNRLVQGIVVNVKSADQENSQEATLAESEQNKAFTDFKEIKELLDPEPVLSTELLELAEDMRHRVFSYKISILKAMLPNLLNSKYDKLLISKSGESLRWSDLSEIEQIDAMKKAQRGDLEIRYEAHSKETRKLEKFLIPDWSALEAFEIKANAKKRQEFKEFLLEADKKIPYKEAVKIFSRPIIKFFEENQLLKIEEVEISRMDSSFSDVKADQPKVLNQEQTVAFEQIIAHPEKPSLLEGITGSGKTEVYLQVIAESLKAGKTAIMLVPEISLTSQTARRFIARFGKQVALLHSRLSDGERYDEWRRIKRGEARVVVGTRSAIFAPLENIGCIIIDEEHDSSYKQESSPRYHARDVALWRAKYHGASLVLGSATPSLESRARAERDLYQLLLLKERANPEAHLPQVEIVDMRQNLNDQSSNFSEALLQKIAEKLEREEQIVLLLNRRGYSSFVMCRECGYVVKCPNCDVGLTLHMDTRTLNCHYCGHRERIPQNCPNCNSHEIRYYGSGTQKVEEELQSIFKEARILRMDVDTTSRKGAHDKLLSAFANAEADILLGTQMIAKGLDFPNVTLVGVINADTGLNLPDFRASERTFELLTQVAGRSGRAEKAGEVLIQTFNPDHYAIQLAAKMDYEDFYRTEMDFRRRLAYPPYYFTVQLVISSKNEDEAVKQSYEMMSILRNKLSDKARILGPIPRPVARTHKFYHYQVLIKYRFEAQLETGLNEVLDLSQLPENKNLRLIIDSEPMSFV